MPSTISVSTREPLTVAKSVIVVRVGPVGYTYTVEPSVVVAVPVIETESRIPVLQLEEVPVATTKTVLVPAASEVTVSSVSEAIT